MHEIQQNQWSLAPTFVVRAPPPSNEAVGEVEDELMGHTVRSAGGLDVAGKFEGRAETKQHNIAVRCEVIIVLMHFHLTDVADLRMSSWI